VNIAIAGMGVAGSYLSSRLGSTNRVVVFERMSRENFDAVCAWGTAKAGIEGFAKKCGLNFEDYITYEGKVMYVEVGGELVDIELKGLCCFDKPRFIRDMAEGQDVRYGHPVSKDIVEGGYDLVIDATGFSRLLLPKVKDDLLIPCLQYKVKYRDPPFDDFYIKPFPGLSGYFWYFPLGGGYYHIGAGDYFKRHIEELSSFIKRYPGEVLKKNGRPIRITPPQLCEPFYEGRVVGAGESIGAVYPMLGEGIIPSLECAELLVENIEDLERYRRLVFKKFKVYERVFRFIKSKLTGTFNLKSQLPNLLLIYRYMKRREDRYGMYIEMKKILKIVLEA